MNLYPFGKAVTHALVRILFKMRYEGLENIPKGGGYILASNHRSFFDPMFIAHKISPDIHFLAKEELVTPPVIGAVIRTLGVVPVRRGAGDTGALDEAARLIRGGGVLGIFPEGTRSRDGMPLRPRSGLAIIAGKTRADILPCAVCFGRRLGFRQTVTVRYGPLIRNERLALGSGAPSSVKAASRMVMEEIVALAGAGQPALPGE